MSVTAPSARPVPVVTIEHTTAILDDFFAYHIREAQTISAAYASLWQEMQRLANAGGKRLRPKMVLLSYHAFDGQDSEIIAPIAAACELLHQSMLIHDDIIDRDTVRYGVPNISGAYLEQYSAMIKPGTARRHYADSSAMLAGDMLLAGAYQVIQNIPLAESTKLQVLQLFNRCLFEVIGGELIDTEAAFRGSTADRALTVARYKTAGYSFIAPLLMGATAAGASSRKLEALRQYAEQLGIAFQLQDDILGTFGNAALTGKTTSGDITEGKRTFMVESFYDLANPGQLEQFSALYGNPKLAAEDIERVRQLLIDSGARSATELKISQLEAGALAALASLKLPTVWHDEFISLINKSLKRSV